MRVLEKASLLDLNTFGVPASAALRIDIESEEDLTTLPSLHPAHDLVLGGGSNVLIVSDIPGTVYVNRIRGRAVIKRDQDSAIVEVGAGENWHELVLWTLGKGLSGLENLSLIPGSVGAAPMQNIGAYGVELSSVLESVTAWDWQQQHWNVFSNSECRFGYRDSRFKSLDRDRFLITSIRLELSTGFSPTLDYASLAEALSGVERPTPVQVSDAVIRIRRQSLPDPAKIGNAGSFFKNPVISADAAEEFRSRHPDLPGWPTGTAALKIPAAWMIEACGLKGHSIGHAAVSEQHALVLVNRGEATGTDVWELAQHVRATVLDAFGVELEVEPVIIDFGN